MSDQEKHLVHGKIIERIDRPPKNLIDRFAKHDTAKVADSMAGLGVMDYEIKPLTPEMRIVGTALTVLTRPGDALFVQKAIDLTQPGDVIVIDGGGFKNVCVIGERLGYFYKLKGAVGIIVDGAVRDSQGMIEESPPTFARSVCINIFGSAGPGAINVPIQCGGVLVHPGDIVMGDRDGVVVIPKDDAPRVLDLADKHLEGELARLKRVEAGQSVTEVFALEPKLTKWTR
jgi:4-hydroxy-4-methyl-2-oxoglutarate aldolase